MSLKFYSDKNSIYAVYRKQDRGRKVNLKYFPGISLEGESLTGQRTKSSTINNQLSKIESSVYEIEKEVDMYNLSSEMFSKLVENRIFEHKADNTSFYDYCNIYFEQSKKDMGYERAKQIQTTINKIREFRPGLNFDHIDKKFYRDLIYNLEEQGYYANYIGSIIKNLKRILNFAEESGVKVHPDFKRFKKPSEEVYNVYLNEKEIEAIHNLNITTELLNHYNEYKRQQTKKRMYNITGTNLERQVKALKKAKDLFVIGCWTGLRVENYLSIDPNLQVDIENRLLHVIANKNGPKLSIPLHRIVIEIYKTTGFPETVSQQKLNEHVKVLGELAGIDETIIYSRTIGGKRQVLTKPKYEMITSHTARRSFASNLTVKGIPKQFIMAVTGHSTEKSFNKYIQAVEKDMLTRKLMDYDVWD